MMLLPRLLARNDALLVAGIAAAGFVLSCLSACAPPRRTTEPFSAPVAIAPAHPQKATPFQLPAISAPAPAAGGEIASPDARQEDVSWPSEVADASEAEGEFSSGPSQSGDIPQPEDFALTALEVALEQIGVPYRRGGTSPRGFDCSGLVRFAFGQAGFDLPHGAAAQYRLAHKVERDALEPGDLVFFRVRGRHIDHVGIYLDGSDFVHAPSPGKTVAIASLEEPYWRRSFVGAGRLL